MTDAEISAIWEREKVGGCVHEFRCINPDEWNYVQRQRTGVCKPEWWFICECGDVEWYPENDAQKVTEYVIDRDIPDHANDPAVFRECVVKLIDAEWMPYKIVLNKGQYYGWKKGHVRRTDPDPNHAAILAVLKIEGVEV